MGELAAQTGCRAFLLEEETRLGGELSNPDSFDLEDKQSRPDKDKAGRQRFLPEKWTYLKINGGGAEVLLRSFEGNIYLRKHK